MAAFYSVQVFSDIPELDLQDPVPCAEVADMVFGRETGQDWVEAFLLCSSHSFRSTYMVPEPSRLFDHSSAADIAGEAAEQDSPKKSYSASAAVAPSYIVCHWSWSGTSQAEAHPRRYYGRQHRVEGFAAVEDSPELGSHSIGLGSYSLPCSVKRWHTQFF